MWVVVAVGVGLWTLLYALVRFVAPSQLGQATVQGWLDRNQITVGPGYVVWETLKFNNMLSCCLVRHKVRSRAKLWFSAGAIATMLLSVASLSGMVVFIAKSIFTSNSVEAAVNTVGKAAQPVLPGVNFPLRWVGCLGLATMISVSVHEYGHAAASTANAHEIEGVGLMLLGAMFGAYVRVPKSLELDSTWVRLQVYCAGVWHNICVIAVGLLIIQLLPALLWFGYTTGTGAVVLASTGAFSGHLLPGDMIVGVESDSILSVHDYQMSLYKLNIRVENGVHPGYCGDSSIVSLGMENIDCCMAQGGDGNTCFAVQDHQAYPSLTCLSAKALASQWERTCLDNSFCGDHRTCIRPDMLSKGEILARVVFLRDGERTTLAFAGSPSELMAGLELSDLLPRSHTRYLPGALTWPRTLLVLIRLTIGISLTMAAFNSLPMYATDGDHIYLRIISTVCGRVGYPTFIKPIHSGCKLTTTILVGAVLLCGVATLLR